MDRELFGRLETFQKLTLRKNGTLNLEGFYPYAIQQKKPFLHRQAFLSSCSDYKYKFWNFLYKVLFPEKATLSQKTAFFRNCVI